MVTPVGEQNAQKFDSCICVTLSYQAVTLNVMQMI